jgi:hypothetical protein
VADSEIELLKQAKFIANYCLDPMCSTDEINFQVGCQEFIKKVDAYILIKNARNTMKVCENKINGSCTLHNLYCNYPNCEKA